MYRHHIEQLAQEHGIQVTYLEPDPDRGWFGRAFPRPRSPRIETLEPVDWDTFLVALHELGHILDYPDGWQSTARPGDVPGGGDLVSELAAWRWAFQNSPVTLTAREADMVLQRQYRLARRAGATSRFGPELVSPPLRPRYEDTLRTLECLYAGHLVAWPEGRDDA